MKDRQVWFRISKFAIRLTTLQGKYPFELEVHRVGKHPDLTE